jgi:hypothetical protein
MLRNRKVTELAPLVAALLASLFSVGTARAQSNDRRGLANSDRQSDFAVFNPATHAPSPPSDLLKGNVGENGSAVSVHELSIPDKAREAYNKGIRQADADDWAGGVPNFQRAIKSFPAYYEAYCGVGVAEVLERGGSVVSQVHRTEWWDVRCWALWSGPDSLPPEAVSRGGGDDSRGYPTRSRRCQRPLFLGMGAAHDGSTPGGGAERTRSSTLQTDVPGPVPPPRADSSPAGQFLVGDRRFGWLP